MSARIDDDDQWIFPKIKLTPEIKKLLLAAVMEVAVRTVFETHVYEFGGLIYHQQQGGPIGLRATGAFSKIVMGDWDLKLVQALRKCGLTKEETARYVDDVRVWMHPIQYGWRWTGVDLQYKEGWREEDAKAGMSKTAKTATELGKIMSSLSTHVKLTTETHEDFESQTLPTLDTQLWMEGNQIKYSFFEKPMASPKVLDSTTAMSQNGLIASLTQEVVRRCKNTSESLPQQTKDEIINRFAVKMANSNHSRAQIHKVITAGLTGYERMLARQLTGGKSIHTPSGLAQRHRKKLLSKTRWFRPDRREKEGGEYGQGNSKTVGGKTGPRTRQLRRALDATTIETRTVLFVEQTKNGKLAKMFREQETRLAELTGFKVKITEMNGTAVKNILHDPNPWALAKCSRPDCYPCLTGDNTSCYKRNITYAHKCQAQGCGKEYVGESSRSAYERGHEHMNDYVKKKPDSHRFKHETTDHPAEAPPEFKFNVIATYKSALTRQIAEAVMIRRRGDKILNSKGMYNRCRLPRLMVENQDLDRKNEEEIKTRRKKQEEKVNQEWRKIEISSKRKPEENRKPAKKTKTENIEEERNTAGKNKRKQYENRKEFERVCKRQRPNFDPEIELEYEVTFAAEKSHFHFTPNKNKKVFWAIFTKQNPKIQKENFSKHKTEKMNCRKVNKIKPPRGELSRPKGGGHKHITSFFHPVENKLKLSLGSAKAECDQKRGEGGAETTGRCGIMGLKIRYEISRQDQEKK